MWTDKLEYACVKMYDSKLNNGLLMTIHGSQSSKLQDPVRVMLYLT